jgi:hypothetical protein
VERTALPSVKSSGAPLGPAKRRGGKGGWGRGGGGRRRKEQVVLVAGAALVGLLLCSVTDVPRRAELSPFSLRKRH